MNLPSHKAVDRGEMSNWRDIIRHF